MRAHCMAEVFHAPGHQHLAATRKGRAESGAEQEEGKEDVREGPVRRRVLKYDVVRRKGFFSLLYKKCLLCADDAQSALYMADIDGYGAIKPPAQLIPLDQIVYARQTKTGKCSFQLCVRVYYFDGIRAARPNEAKVLNFLAATPLQAAEWVASIDAILQRITPKEATPPERPPKPAHLRVTETPTSTAATPPLPPQREGIAAVTAVATTADEGIKSDSPGPRPALPPRPSPVSTPRTPPESPTETLTPGSPPDSAGETRTPGSLPSLMSPRSPLPPPRSTEQQVPGSPMSPAAAMPTPPPPSPASPGSPTSPLSPGFVPLCLRPLPALPTAPVPPPRKESLPGYAMTRISSLFAGAANSNSEERKEPMNRQYPTGKPGVHRDPVSAGSNPFVEALDLN